MALAVDINLWGYGFYSFFSLLSLERIARLFWGKRHTPLLVVVLSLMGMSMVTSSMFLLLNITWLTSFASVICYFAFSFNYKLSWIKRLTGVMAIWMTLFILEGGIASLFGSYFTFTQGHDNLGLPVFFALGIGMYLSVLVLTSFKNITTADELSKSTYGVHLLIPLITLVLVFFSHYLPANVIPIFISILFVMNFIFFYLSDKAVIAHKEKIQGELASQEKERYLTQTQLMQESVKNVRAIRHDMHFHLSTLKGFAADEKALTDYINGLIGNIDESEMFSTTGNVAFDSIINYKLRHAKKDGIGLDLSVLVPPVVSMEIADIVTIVGNLLDNALDGVAKVDEKRITVDIQCGKGNLYIKVDNTFDGRIQYAADGKRITTIKTGEAHGHGLSNIRKAVEKYNGHMDITHDDGIFSVGVFVFLEDM